MEKEEIKLFLHDQLSTLNNIKINIDPLLYYIPIQPEKLDDRIYYFNKIKDHVKKVVELSNDLIKIMEEREVDKNLIIRLTELNDSLQKYLVSEIKFNPPFIYDKLNQYDLFLAILRSEYVPKESIKDIEKETKLIYFLLSEFFLKEAHRLLSYTIEKSKIVLNYLEKGRSPEKEFLPINIIEILAQAIKNEIIGSNQKKIEFRKKYNLEPCFVYGYKPDLIRAFSNIINNAIKYNDSLESSDVWITIDVKILLSRVEIMFENWGVGIEKEEIEKGYIFQNGFRGRQPLDKNISGTGLGLYDASNVIVECGGIIKVSSDRVRHNSEKFLTRVTVSLNKYLQSGNDLGNPK